MANILTGGFETVMSKTVQKFLAVTPTFRTLASFKEQNNLTKGQTVNRPFRTSDFTVEDYVANTDVTATDVSVTASNLTVNNSKSVSVLEDPVENILLQTQPDTIAALWGERMTYRLRDLIDRDFFDEGDNAALDIDDSDFGGTAGNGIDLASVEAERAWGAAFAELMGNRINENKLYAVIDPAMANEIGQRLIGGGFNEADNGLRNGFTGKRFQGFDIFISNNLPATQTFTLTAAVEDTTFTVAGVVWTAKDALGAVAGNVFTDTATVDTWGTNLAKAISNDTPSTFYVQTSTTNRNRLRLQGFAASYVAGTDILTVTAYGRFVASFSAGATAGSQVVKAQCGSFGAVDMVVQMQPSLQINKAPKNLGFIIIGHTLWGTKTFEDGAQRLLKLSIKV